MTQPKFMIILAGNYEEAVLVSGDKYFLLVVEWLRNNSNKTVVVSLGQNPSAESFLKLLSGYTTSHLSTKSMAVHADHGEDVEQP